jgi:peptide/nickel transport system permease protein
VGQYLVRRLIQAIPVLIGITLISFFIIQMAPGDPALLYIDRSTNPSPEDIALVRRELGLDKPIHLRYVDWISRSVKGDFGRSFLDRRPVMKKIAEMMPYTLILSGLSLVVGFTLAIILGVVAAVRVGRIADYVISSISALFVSVPVFWVGLMLILLFSVKLKWFPTSGWSTYGVNTWLDTAHHLVLPVLLLASRDIAGLSRYVRSGLLEVLAQDYVRTARAKGLAERIVVYKHALRNALIPVITLLGLSLPALASGAILTETVFALPGMGRLAIESVNARDYPVIIAINLILSTLTVFGNLMADLAYGLIDPRIRYS